MLEIKNITVTVQQKTVIADFSIAIGSGSIVFLQGPNGSGKSSIVNALIGNPHYQITAGEIFFEQFNLQSLAIHERARRGILVIMQQQVAIPGLLIVDYFFQLYTALYSHPITIKEMDDKLTWAFDFVGLDQVLKKKSLFEGFSGGQKKRLELVHCLVLHPRFVVFDEVDAGLDAEGLAVIPDVIHYCMNKNPDCASLLITHNPFLATIIDPSYTILLESNKI